MADNKEQQLAKDCIDLRDASSQALSWLESNKKLVGAQTDSLKRELKQAAVEARKLSRASQRPTSLAIFGPSQVGKSFLTGTLLLGSPSGGVNGSAMGRVVFGEGDSQQSLNFLTEVNPSGGQETTGLVTRFTTDDPIKSPEGYPVCLRLMTEIDLVKVLANSFVEDLDLDAEVPLTESSVKSLLEEARSSQLDAPVDVLTPEDIYELEHYAADHLRSHPLAKDLADTYWNNLAALAPRLAINERAKLYSLLWGGINKFSELFIELKRTLDMLGHPEWGFVSLDSITNRIPGKTVLHVLTMKHGLADDLSKSEMGRIALADGRSFDIRKPVITALASELRAQLESACWDFFSKTDLLDFPGARSRERVGRAKFFNTEKEPYPIGEAFLRGKVAVLFDNYAADLDLNTLVACHRAEQTSVTSFKHLVDSWVNRTHGSTPEARKSMPVNLFMVVTWCDQLFDESFGEEQLDLKLDNKLSYLKNFSPCINQWTTKQPFNNTYLIRNPAGKKLDTLFNIENYIEEDGKSIQWVEVGYRDDAKEKLQNYHDSFLKTEVSKKYFADPSTKWNAMTIPNDGGVTLLAESLGGACDPNVKYNQLVPKQTALSKLMLAALSPYYEEGDIAERVKKRVSAVEDVIALLRKNISLVPKFVSQFHLGQKYLREVYIDYRHSYLSGVADGLEERDSIGEVIIKSWNRSVEKIVENEIACSTYRLSQDHVQCIIGELDAGLRMASAAQVITDRVGKIEQYAAGGTKHAEYIATTVALLVNDFINYAGCAGTMTVVNSADVETTDQAFFDFNESLTADGMPVLTQHTSDMETTRERFAEEWFRAITELTKKNASSSGGSLIDVEENERLGGILNILS